MEKVVVGFTETKQVIDLVITIGQGIEASLNDDGNITFSDLPNFFAVLFQILPAVQGVENIPIEFKLASDEEAEELKQYVKDKLDLEDDEIEEFIEDAFAVVLDLWQVVKKYFIETELPDLKPTPPSDGDISEDAAPATD